MDAGGTPQELVKDLDACLLTDKEMQRPGNTHWAGSSAMDPPNRIVTTWHAREAVSGVGDLELI